MPRSGTSLLRAFVSSHPNIAMPVRGETQFFLDWSGELEKVRTLKEFQKFNRRFLMESKVNKWGIDWRSFKPNFIVGKRNARQYFDDLMSYYAAKENKPRWGEKSTGHIRKISCLIEYYPEAKFLLVVRDPKDTFCSTRSVKWNKNVKINPSQYGKEWANTYSRAIGELIRSQVDWRVIRHESVVTETHRTLEYLFSWLNEPFSTDLLKPKHLAWEQNSSFGNQDWTLADYKQYSSELKIDPSTVGRWKTELKRDEIFKLEEEAYHALLAFGYNDQAEQNSICQQITLQDSIRRFKTFVFRPSK